jgi:threonine/homoserine/homoserine lactone efflux protein
MTYAENLWLFGLLLFGIIIVPGMDMLFVLANTLARGRAVGLAAVAGIMFGGAIHTVFGAAAVGLLSQLPSLVFQGLLVTGSAYMAWIGVTLLRSSITVDAIDADTVGSRRAAFFRGAVTCLLNPKAYLFVIAVFPQFLKPHFGPIGLQAVVMGTLAAAMQFGVYGGLAAAAGKSRDLLLRKPQIAVMAGRLAGLLLIAGAVVTGWQGLNVA